MREAASRRFRLGRIAPSLRLVAMAALALALWGLRAADPEPLAQLRAAGFDALQGVGPIAADAPPSAVVVGIGERSLAALGPWPWRRARLAQLVEAAGAAGASAVAINLLLDAPDLYDPVRLDWPGAGAGRRLRAALEAIPSGDAALASALAGVRSALATSVAATEPSAGGRGPFALPVRGAIAAREPSFEAVVGAHAPIRAGATTEGAANLMPEADAVLRRAPMVFFAGGVAHPSLPVAAVAALGRPGAVIASDAGVEGVALGDALARTDASGRVFLDFARGAARIARVEASDLIAAAEAPGAGRIPALDARIAVIGVDAVGVGQGFRAADGALVSGAHVAAVAIDALMSGATLARPQALVAGEHAAVLALTLLLALAWARTSPAAAAAACAATAALWVAAAMALRMGAGLVVDVAAPLALWSALALAGALAAAVSLSPPQRPDRGSTP